MRTPKLLASAQGLRYARRAQMAQIDAVGAMRRCTGIGKSIAKKLALQGLNVVLVALQDALLDGTTEELAAAFPAVQIRKVRPAPQTTAELLMHRLSSRVLAD